MRTASFRALGSDAGLVVVGGTEDDVAATLDLVTSCERRWSRFLPTSELTQLNRAAGSPVLLPRDTYDLVAAAVDCWSLTAGRFDPTVLDALEAAGYDDSFERASRTRRASAPAPGCADIGLDDELAMVTLPPGVHLDLGGIGKGHVADLAVANLIERGVAGALVDLGGDVRAAGASRDGDAWIIGVADPFVPADDLTRLRVHDGAVATSSVRRRRWRSGDIELHHVIDPTTGRPADTTLAAVTVVAASAAWAEVTAKAAIVAGAAQAADVVRAAGATGLLVHDDGRLTALDGLEAFA